MFAGASRTALEPLSPAVAEQTAVTRWRGEDCDYGMVVDALLRRDATARTRRTSTQWPGSGLDCNPPTHVNDSLPGVRAGFAAGMQVFALVNNCAANRFKEEGATPFHCMSSLLDLLANS